MPHPNHHDNPNGAHLRTPDVPAPVYLAAFANAAITIDTPVLEQPKPISEAHLEALAFARKNSIGKRGVMVSIEKDFEKEVRERLYGTEK